MVSAVNQRAIEADGLSFILGAKVPELPYAVKKWRAVHPDEPIPDGHVLTQPWLAAAASDKRLDQVINYQCKPDPARRTRRGSTNRSPRPRRSSPGGSRSGATGSSSSPAPTRV